MTDAEIETAFDEHKDAVYRFAWRMTGSTAAAEDVTQDTFLSLVRHPQRFDPVRGALRPFLLGIARNLAMKRWRNDQRWTALDEEAFVAHPIEIEQRDMAELVGLAVRTLPPYQREVLILAHYEELSLEETARAVAAEVGTVKSRLHRARQNLRRMLAPAARNVRL